MDADFKSIGGINVEPGALIAKRFEICDRLGAGGVGMVFRAIDHELDGEVVALKLLHPHLAQDENVFRRFRNEVLVARSLSHPNIVRTHDMGRAEAGFSYISMEFVDGESLKDKLTSGDKPRGLPFKDAVAVLYQIISGVAYAHGKGVIHRDLKPANVMISSKGEVKLADFGTARIVGGDTSLTQTGQVIGTPDYMSPEQIRGEQLDHGCDIYSLGIVAYELVVGARPFVADSAVAVAFKHLNDPIPEFATPQSGIPLWYDAVVRRATAKRKEDRFATAMEFAAALLESVPELSMQSTFFGMERPLVRAPSTGEVSLNGKHENGLSQDRRDTMITPTAVATPAGAPTAKTPNAESDRAFEIGKRVPDRDAQDWKLGSLGADAFNAPPSPRRESKEPSEHKGVGPGTALLLIVGSLLLALGIIPRVSKGAATAVAPLVASLGGSESLPGFLLAALTGTETPVVEQLPPPKIHVAVGPKTPPGVLPAVPTPSTSQPAVAQPTVTPAPSPAPEVKSAPETKIESAPEATAVVPVEPVATVPAVATVTTSSATPEIAPTIAPTVAPVVPREVLVSVELRQGGRAGQPETISIDQLSSVRWIAEAQGITAKDAGVTAEKVRGEFVANVVDPKESRIVTKLKPDGVDLAKAEGTPTHISGSMGALRGFSPRAGQYRLDVLRHGEIVASTDFSLYLATVQPSGPGSVANGNGLNQGGGVITIVTEGQTGGQGYNAPPTVVPPVAPTSAPTSVMPPEGMGNAGTGTRFGTDIAPPGNTRGGLPRAKGHADDEEPTPPTSEPATIAPQLPVEPAPSVASESYSGVLSLPLKTGGDERHAVTLNLTFTDGKIGGNATVDGFGEFTVSGSVLPRGLSISLANVEYNFGLSSGPKKQNFGGTVQSAILRQNGTWQVSRTR